MASGSESGEVPDDLKNVVIKTFATRDAANLAAAQLEANGIACWLTTDDLGGLLPNLAMASGVRLLVSPSDEEKARDLLDVRERSPQPKDWNNVSGPNSYRQKFGVVPFIAGIIIGVLATLVCVPSIHPGRRTHYHYAANGKPDEAWVYVDGNLSKHMEDRNHDGAFDYWAYYDEHGQVERVECDNNFDGKVDETWTYSNGELITMEKDNDFNGVPDEFCTYKNHIIQQLDMRPNGSTFTTVREIFSNGVLTEIRSGGDSNGNFKEIVKYDPFFEPISTNSSVLQLLTVP